MDTLASRDKATKSVMSKQTLSHGNAHNFQTQLCIFIRLILLKIGLQYLSNYIKYIRIGLWSKMW